MERNARPAALFYFAIADAPRTSSKRSLIRALARLLLPIGNPGPGSRQFNPALFSTFVLHFIIFFVCV
jgi:hypothetical protein